MDKSNNLELRDKAYYEGSIFGVLEESQSERQIW